MSILLNAAKRRNQELSMTAIKEAFIKAASKIPPQKARTGSPAHLVHTFENRERLRKQRKAQAVANLAQGK